MAELTLNSVVKHYGRKASPAINDLNLEVGDGEIVALLGPTGSGKTTVLRLIAGLESCSQGEIKIGRKVVNGVRPKDRRIGFAFSGCALYPTLTVRENLALNLTARRASKKEIEQRIAETAERFGIEALLDRKPAALSAADKLRVNIARAIIRRPSLLLVDDPLDRLDGMVHVLMRTEIKRLFIETGLTTVIATRSPEDAMALADRVAVLSSGNIQQYAVPAEIFNHPANEFVATLLAKFSNGK
jgi:multiple sugar transport system ATP-binding protein